MNPTPISPPSWPVPPGTCDCHVHVFWPARFPYDAQRKYTPPPADVPALHDLRDRLAFTRSVLVQPSCYGHDNAALVAALAELGPQAARGVCVVDPARVTDGELATLHQAGVRGLRLNAHVQGMDAGHLVTLCRQAAARVAGLGWHLQLHVSGPMLAAIQKVLCTLKVPVVLDHFGGGAPAADSVAELLASGQIWLKLSAPYRVSTQPGYDDLAAAVQRYLRIAPQRLLWASDWPHTGGDGARTADIGQIEPFRAEDAGAALNRLARWVEDPAQLHAILVLNPAALYGFEPATPFPLPAFHRKITMITSINPATGQALASFDLHTPAQVDGILARTAAAQRQWARQPVPTRAALLTRVAAVLRQNRDAYARLITREMGKPIAEAESEVEKSAVTCEFYAQAAPTFLADSPVATNAADTRVVFDPLGVVLAVMPWNYPFWQFVRFAAPALAAGNGAVLKHANNVPGCALALEAAFREAGTPDGLVSTLLINASEVAGVLADPRVAAVTLTGSTAVGKLVAAQAGSLMKKQVLELGGSDPFIVLADADIGQAAQTAVKARFSNTGQSCISAKRFIVEEAVADRFVEAFVRGVRALKLGDPEQRDTQIGPLARANLRDDIHSQVERTLDAGATLLTGGRFADGPGFFYEPTVLDHVTPDMAAAVEETFGPAAAVIRVRDADEAIAVANATEFGLGAALWTRDLDAAATLVRRIEAGAVFVNALVASDARVPFGGIKESGYGRELGDFGIREFTNIKTVWVGPNR